MDKIRKTVLFIEYSNNYIHFFISENQLLNSLKISKNIQKKEI